MVSNDTWIFLWKGKIISLSAITSSSPIIVLQPAWQGEKKWKSPDGSHTGSYILFQHSQSWLQALILLSSVDFKLKVQQESECPWCRAHPSFLHTGIHLGAVFFTVFDTNICISPQFMLSHFYEKEKWRVLCWMQEKSPNQNQSIKNWRRRSMWWNSLSHHKMTVFPKV